MNLIRALTLAIFTHKMPYFYLKTLDDRKLVENWANSCIYVIDLL